MKDGARFTEHMWNIICITLDHVLKHTTPTEVFAYVPPPKQPARGRRVSNRNESKKDPKSTRNTPKGSEIPGAIKAGDEGSDSRRQSQEGNEGTKNQAEGSEEAERIRSPLFPPDEEIPSDVGRSPEELMVVKLKRATPPKPAEFSLPTAKAKCGVHLLLIQAVNEIFHEHFEHLSLHNITTLLDTITESHRFAYGANNDLDLRANLSPTGDTPLSSG